MTDDWTSHGRGNGKTSMTEREQLTAWLDRCDIPYWESENQVMFGKRYEDPAPEIWKDRPGDETRITGYNRFYTLFEFDDADNLLEVGAWE